MRKLSFIGCLLLATIFVYGQKKELNNAYNAYQNEYWDKAKDAVDKAILNDETAKDAKTWMYRGNVYLRLADIREKNYQWERAKKDSLELGRPAPILTRNQQNEREYLNLCVNCAEIAYESYLMAFQLDPKITVENMGINDPGKGFGYCAGYLYSDALRFYELGAKDTVKEKAKENYEKAYALLEKANNAAAETQDYIKFLLAYTAEQIEKIDVAKKIYNEMIKKSKDIRAFQRLASIYKSENDTVKVLSVMRAGESIFIIEDNKDEEKEIKNTKDKNTKENKDTTKENRKDTLYRDFVLSYSIFLSWAGKPDEAADIIDNALEKYPNNHLLLISYGTALSDDKQYAKAEKYLKQALEMKPNEYTAIFNLGTCYYNNYVDTRREIESIVNNNDYNKAVEKAEKLLELARPYLEQAHEIDAKDRNTMFMLRAVYLQLGLMDEYKAMDEKYSALGK